mgnify:FL=1
MSNSWYSKFKVKPEHKQSGISIRINVLCASEAISESTRAFLRSLLEHYEKKGGLTERQYEALCEAEENATPEALLRHNKWVETFSADNKKLMRICAQYYYETQYFTATARRVLDDDNYIPPENMYRSMCENQHAKKLIEATLGEPRFENGSLVQLRANARPYKNFAKGHIAIVLRSGHVPVVSAVKGGKPYEVLPFGSSESVTVEERYIKKAVDKSQLV